MEKKHPRFLGFLWKRHKFERRKDLPCWEKCIYCDEQRHNPRKGEVEVLHSEESQRLLRHGILFEEQKCRVCGKVERSFRGLHYNGFRF